MFLFYSVSSTQHTLVRSYFGQDSLVRLGGQSLVALLSNAQLHTLALGQRDVGLGALADDEHVRQAGGEHVSLAVLDVHNVEGSRVPLAVHDGSDTSQIPSSGDHGQVACKTRTEGKTVINWKSSKFKER